MRACRRGLHVCLKSNVFSVLKRTSLNEDDWARHDKQEGLDREIPSCWAPQYCTVSTVLDSRWSFLEWYESVVDVFWTSANLKLHSRKQTPAPATLNHQFRLGTWSLLPRYEASYLLVRLRTWGSYTPCTRLLRAMKEDWSTNNANNNMEQMLYDILGTVGYNFNFNNTFDHSSLEFS